MVIKFLVIFWTVFIGGGVVGFVIGYVRARSVIRQMKRGEEQGESRRGLDERDFRRDNFWEAKQAVTRRGKSRTEVEEEHERSRLGSFFGN